MVYRTTVSFADVLKGAVVMAPMTKGSNLPYRQLCVELGARITVSEMTLVRRLKQRHNTEFALIRRFAGEPCFGVQLAGTRPEEVGWAAALVESKGADFVDINFGCPIDYFTRKGLGAAAGRQPNRMRRLVAAMKESVTRIPVTAKIRLGWNEEDRNYLKQAQAAVDGGADALFVHGRTRNGRYRSAADWDAIGQIAAHVPVPVIGNGDVLFPRDIDAFRARAGCAGVMVARAALIKPWIFREATQGYWDITVDERLQIYRRYVELAKAHWGADAHGLARVRTFVKWHLDFWRRYVPRQPDGNFPSMQRRETWQGVNTPLEALFARGDEAAINYLTSCLVDEQELEPARVPDDSKIIELLEFADVEG
jgi:tRNA-dihydrouridine synthase 3